MIYQVELEEEEVFVLNAIANRAKIAPEEYVQNIVRAFIKNQILGIYRTEFDKKSLEELKTLFGTIKK